MYYAKALGNFLLDPTSVFSKPEPVDPSLAAKLLNVANEYKEEAGLAVTAAAVVWGTYRYGGAIAKRLPLIGRAFQEQLVKLDAQLQAKVEADLQGFEAAVVDMIKGITLQDILGQVAKDSPKARKALDAILNKDNFGSVVESFLDQAKGSMKARINKADLSMQDLCQALVVVAHAKHKAEATVDTKPKAKV